MNSLSLPSLSLPRKVNIPMSLHRLQNLCSSSFHLPHRGNRHSSLSLSHSFTNTHFPLYARRSKIGATAPTDEGAVSVVNFEDLKEKDWSFLEHDNTNSAEEHDIKINRIISAGEIGETSRVLVSIGSEEFVDRLVEKSKFDHLTVVHNSLFVLAGIKEKYDEVKCWQGELIEEPESWAPLDVVFLYFLIGLTYTLDHILEALSKCCLPGARIVISHPQGREVSEQQQHEYPDVVISELPEKAVLQKVAIQHSFELTEHVDETGFYLAVLKFCKVE